MGGEEVPVAEFPITPRNRVRRLPDRAAYDHEAVFAVLDAALVAHVGYVVDGQPFVTPTAFWRKGTRLYWHGSKASRMHQAQAQGLSCCVTVTHLDGLVLARSAFNHSLNYRSAMAYGTARLLPDGEKAQALEDFMERLCPGRSRQARPGNEAELRQTVVVYMDIEEAVVKTRSGGPHDDEEDLGLPVWAGVVPLTLRVGVVEPDGAPAQPGPEPWERTPGQAFDRLLGGQS
jgi:nitroimidazol reductase NimA-like FMN-containing flavoprotein (pyridoxamine 5'-phosphate oxidase superfamily)